MNTPISLNIYQTYNTYSRASKCDKHNSDKQEPTLRPTPVTWNSRKRKPGSCRRRPNYIPTSTSSRRLQIALEEDGRADDSLSHDSLYDVSPWRPQLQLQRLPPRRLPLSP